MDLIRAMKAFSAVVDEGGFASASRAMDAAPASVTRLIADLEQHLGARLLNRTTRHLSLTPIGEDYLARVRSILSDIEEAETLVSLAHKECRGRVRLKVPTAFAVHQLAKVMHRFALRCPGVQVSVCASDQEDADIDESFDLTILACGEPLDGRFVARRLARSRLIVSAAPAYWDRHGKPGHPDDLRRHCVLTAPAEATRRQGAGGARGPGLTTTSVEMAYAAIVSGLGIGVLPSFVVEEALTNGALERVLPDWPLPELTLWLCWPSRLHVPARTRALLDFLLAEFTHPAGDPWLERAARSATGITATATATAAAAGAAPGAAFATAG